MAFWDKWFKRETTVNETRQPDRQDRELVENWIQSINDSIVRLKEELYRIPTLTVSELNRSFELRNGELTKKLDELPEKIVGPLKEVINLSKQEILTELIRISSHHDVHDSASAHGKAVVKPFQEISKNLTGKQKRLLALLLDSGFLSYAEIGEKLGITHESAKNFVNRLLKNGEKSRLFSKQETEDGIRVGLSDEIQDELLKKKYRTMPNDSA
jgi:DNA-binding MarR family transcriptional regulator